MLQPPSIVDKAARLAQIFNSTLGVQHRVQLIGGAPEPLYLPASEKRKCAEIHFREDYASSALHELAHWCLAGKKRRELEDYGYWYESVRDKSGQQRFEEAEIKPQATEWILSAAAGQCFRISSDNFLLESFDVEPFRHRVQSMVNTMLERGLPTRTEALAQVLAVQMPEGDLGFSNKAVYKSLPDK